MLHYTRMPTREWWKHKDLQPWPSPYPCKHPWISEFEEETAERYRHEYEANETRRMMEVYNDIRINS
jgi:hypothetical protein